MAEELDELGDFAPRQEEDPLLRPPHDAGPSSKVWCYCCYTKKRGKEATWWCSVTPCCCCCCCFLWLLLFVALAQVGLGLYLGHVFVLRHSGCEQSLSTCPKKFCGKEDGPMLNPSNMTPSLWFPGCTQTYLLQEMHTFNEKKPWQLVKFPSRPGAAGQGWVQLEAWWLPADQPTAPRIIVVHEANANFDDWTVQLPAYFLRSMGFAVLIPNLRDHGTSGNSKVPGKITWGWAYHLDVLGAMDFLVADPVGVLGGGVPASQVGFMGFGIGAMAAAIAAGVESTVPAVWLESGLFDAKESLLLELRKVVGPLAPGFLPAAWFAAGKLSNVELDHMTPGKALLKRAGDEEINALIRQAAQDLAVAPTPCPGSKPDLVVPAPQAKLIATIIADRDDPLVPVLQSEQLAGLMDEFGHEVHEWYYENTDCGSGPKSVLPVWQPDAYRQKLCEHWSAAFGKLVKDCGIDFLPHFSTVLAAEPDWVKAMDAPTAHLA